MSTPTTRQPRIPCLTDSSHFVSSTSLAQLAAHHRRTASVPVTAEHYQPGHQRSRSWLNSFLKATPHEPREAVDPTVDVATRRRRTTSLGASLKRKMRNLGLPSAELENAPPPRPAPPTLLPDQDMAELRIRKLPLHSHRVSLPHPAASNKARNASWDWDGGEGNRDAAQPKGHARRGGYKTMSLDGGMTSGARVAKGGAADLGSIWETFTEENDEGDLTTFDAPPDLPLKDRKGSVSRRRVPVPTFIPFPSALTPTESLFDPLDVSGQLNHSVANTSTSHFDLDGFPPPPVCGEAPRFEDEEERLESEDEEGSYVWNPATLPSRQSSLASRRDRALPAPLVIGAEPASGFDEPTPSPTDSQSVYSTHDDPSPEEQQRASYFSPITPTFPIDSSAAYSPTSLQPTSTPTGFNRGGRSEGLVSPRSSIPALRPAPRRSPILEGLAISSGGLLTPPKHQGHASASSPLALRTLKALPLLPLPDQEDLAPPGSHSPLANSLPFAHTSFLSPFSTDNSPPPKAPSPHPSPRSQSRPSPPRFPIPSSTNVRNLSASLGSSTGFSSEIDRQEAWAREESRRATHSVSDDTPYNPSPRIPSSSIFTTTTRLGEDFSPYQHSVSSFETRASSVHSGDVGRRGKHDPEQHDWSAEDSDEENDARDADSSRERGERWIQHEMSGNWAGQYDEEYGTAEEEEEEEEEDTVKVVTYSRREMDRREEERRIRYAKERASLYAEPGPDEAYYEYGVAM